MLVKTLRPSQLSLLRKLSGFTTIAVRYCWTLILNPLSSPPFFTPGFWILSVAIILCSFIGEVIISSYRNVAIVENDDYIWLFYMFVYCIYKLFKFVDMQIWWWVKFIFAAKNELDFKCFSLLDGEGDGWDAVLYADCSVKQLCFCSLAGFHVRWFGFLCLCLPLLSNKIDVVLWSGPCYDCPLFSFFFKKNFILRFFSIFWTLLFLEIFLD